MYEDVLVFRLHHVVALRSQTRHVAVHVNTALMFDSFEHRIDDDEGASATDPCTAVHHHRTAVGRRHRFDASHEEEERRGVVGNAVVGPRCELELTHFAAFLWVILVRNRKRSNRVGCKLHDVTKLYTDDAVLFRAAIRPILITFDLKRQEYIIKLFTETYEVH